jgi:pimeloyl-ACP methyl ester carboxylesterase
MKPSLLLFHGALGSSRQLESFAYELREDFNCIPFDFSGHGGKNFEQEFDIFQFANEIYEICKKRKTKPFAFGYSMGGYAALLAEHTFKNMFKGIITLGTKFDWNPQVAISEKVMLNPELIEKNFPAYANTLIERHKPNNWKNVLEKTSDLIHHLGENAPLNESTLKEIKTPVLEI